MSHRCILPNLNASTLRSVSSEAGKWQWLWQKGPLRVDSSPNRLFISQNLTLNRQTNFAATSLIASSAIVDKSLPHVPWWFSPSSHKFLKVEFELLRSLIRRDHLLVSIVAGTSLRDLCDRLGTERIVRVMPNTPCQVGMGASGAHGR